MNSHSSISSDVVLSARGVSKKFCKNMRRSMTYGISEMAKNFMGIKPDFETLRKKEFWALDEVDLELRRGEVLGLIGHNGCGKSTLLRLLAGILPIDKGEIVCRGRVSALIALGAGFHPHMTARENVFLNGTILGMKNGEIRKKFDSIIDFSELEQFVDAPIATFSSGMRVRLGFAIAIHSNPEILLVDEVLAVGDVGFRAKCYQYISRLLEGSGIILVTHSMAHVARYCNRVVLLDKGKVAFCGESRVGIEKYLCSFDEQSGGILVSDSDNVIESLEMRNSAGEITDSIAFGECAAFHLVCRVCKAVKHPKITVWFHNHDLQTVAQCRSEDGCVENINGRVVTSVDIGPINLRPADYRISVTVHDEGMQKTLLWYSCYWPMVVAGSARNYGSCAVAFGGKWRVDSQ